MDIAFDKLDVRALSILTVLALQSLNFHPKSGSCAGSTARAAGYPHGCGLRRFPLMAGEDQAGVAGLNFEPFGPRCG